jgi:hypothetical protein
MRQSSLGTVVAVTFTREIRPGRLQTTVIDSQHVPTGLSLSPTAVARFLTIEHREIARSRYHRPSHGR